jgi:hypothetical protein
MLAAWSWFGFWMFIHILAVIVAFGPNVVMVPMIGAMSQKHPQYTAFAAEVIHVFESKVVLPLAVIIPLAGTGLIYTGHVDFWGEGWLVAATVLYALTFAFAFTIQLRNSSKFLAIVKAMPPGPPPPGAEPPAELAALGKKLMRGGQALTLALVVLTILMVGGREGWFG